MEKTFVMGDHAFITKAQSTLESSETITATTGEQTKLIEITCCKEIFTCKACNVSGRGTRFSEHLMKHLLLLPYKCLHCDESFSLRKEIGAHMQKKHPGKEKKSALRANKRANTILGEAEKKGSCSFKSNFVHISPKANKKSNDGTLHASVSSSNKNINNSNFSALEPEKNAQVSNTESEEGKQNVSHNVLEAKSHCEKKMDRPNDSKSESFRVAVDKNVDGTEGSENMPVLQTESNVQLNRKLKTKGKIDKDVLSSSAESKNVKLENPEDNIVPSKPKSVDKTNVGESGLLTNENHVNKCSFVSSFQSDNLYDNQKENSNEDNNSDETNSGNVTASENSIIKVTTLMNGDLLSSDVKQNQEHYLNSDKQIDCDQADIVNKSVELNKTHETYQDVVPKVKAPAQMEEVVVTDNQDVVPKVKAPAQLEEVEVTDNDKVDNSPVKNSLRYADDCKYNSVEHATSDKSCLLNTSEHTYGVPAVGTKLRENDSKSQTVSSNTCNSSVPKTKPKSTVGNISEMEAKNESHGNSSTKVVHRSEILQSEFNSQAVSNIQQQTIASMIQPSTQIFQLIGPGVVPQYVHVQNVQNKIVIPPVIRAGGVSVSAVNNKAFTPVTPIGVINTSKTMTSYIVVPLSVPPMPFAPIGNIQQGVFPVTSQRTVATVADSRNKTQIVPNLETSHSYAQRIIIQNQNVVPVPVSTSGEDANISQHMGPRNKRELCTSNERVEPEKEYVSEKIEKPFDDIVFEEEIGNEKGGNEKKTDILTAIVGDEYFCGKCRIRWKKKELFWFHLWNHQHIGGILCNKCVRINGPAGELSCAWTDSFISKLQEKKEKNSKMYSIVRVDCTPNVPVDENKTTLPSEEDKARCPAEENKTSFPTDESEHDSRAQETDNNEQHAEDNDSNDMGLKILECKSLNIEEFEEISSGEQNEVETIKSNSDPGEKEKEMENPSDSDNPGQDNLEMCLTNTNHGEQEKNIPSDSYNPGQDNLEMCLKNSSSIDDLISEVQKHLPSKNVLSCDESVTMDHFVPVEEELNVDVEYLSNESRIAMDLSTLKTNSEMFSHVQPPAYNFYVCGGTCSFSCLLPGDFKQHLTTCKCINTELFSCFHCRFVGDNVDALLRHMHKHAVCHKNTGSKPTNAVFVCSITNCKFSTNILNAFYGHCCQVHPNETSHTCLNCEESFPTAEDLAQHLKVNLLSVVSCKHCMAKDIDKNIVMEHILFEHPGKGKMLNTVKQLLCKERKIYGYYTYQSSLNILDVAMSQSNATVQAATVDASIQECDGSNIQDSSQASSEQQMEESKKPKHSYSKDSMCCHICNFVASAVSELNQHLTCHEQTPAEDSGLSFICPACPMQVKTLKNFEDHAACHAKNVSFWLYDCPLGDYQTNQVTLMLQHIKKEGHSCESGVNVLLGNEKYINSKVITCTCCKFKTTSVAHLDDHMTGHSIITAKDPAVRVAAHSTTDVDTTSESVHRTHSQQQNVTTTKDRFRHCSKDESRLVKNSTKRRFSSDASKISTVKDPVIFTLPCDSVFQTALSCPQCSFSAFFKTNMLKHIKEKHPMVKVKESSQTVSPVQAKSPKTALSSANEVCGLEDSDPDKLEGMKLGSSELDATLATFYKKSGSVLICKMCEKQCSQKNFLHHHILDHLKLNLWKCTSCDFQDNRRFVIIKHAKKNHSSSDGCVAPVEDFLSRLSEHKCKKSPRKPSFQTTVSDGPLCSAEMNEALKCFYKKEDWCLGCVVCKIKCNSIVLMHKHVLQIHLKHAMFGCNLCWFEGFEEHEVLEHILDKHPSKPATVLHLSNDIGTIVKGFIDSCPTSIKSLLLHHQNIKKKKLILGNDDMDSFLNCLYEVNRRLKLVCLICKEELSTKYASHRHILGHLGVDLVGCSCCSFKAMSDRDVTEHMKSSHAGMQLKIDYLDVDIAEAVKNFFEKSCKAPIKERKSKGEMQKRQTVKKSKATSSTSKVRKPWKGSSSSDTQMGNKKDVTKIIVSGLRKYKCRFCEYLALSERSVRAHIFRSHPKREGNLFKCSKCQFQVESLVEITSHMFQKHPWTLEDGFEDCYPSVVSQSNDNVHSTHSGNPFVELETSDSVHSTHSCIEADTSEKNSAETLLANKPFSEDVSSTKSTLNDGSTHNTPESLSMHTKNSLKQSDLGVEHITDHVNSNEADHSTCKSSGHHHGVLTDTHPRLDKDFDKIADHDEHNNLELCSMDNEVASTLRLEVVSMNKNGSENDEKTDQCVHGDDESRDSAKGSVKKSRICSDDSDDDKTKERLDEQPRIDDQSMHIDIHERESIDSVKTHDRTKDMIDVGDCSVSNDKTHRNVNLCVYSDISDEDSMDSVRTNTKREKSTSADDGVGCKGEKANDLNLYSDSGANKLANFSTGYSKTKENDSVDSKETNCDKEHNIGNQFSDISDDETTNLIQGYNKSKSSVDAVCGNISKNTQIDYQGLYSDISDDELTNSTTACSRKRKIDLVDDCVSNKTSFNKRPKQKKHVSTIHGDDKKETTHVKRKNMKQKVMIGSPNSDNFTGTKQKSQVQISCIDSNITENVQPHKAVLDVSTKKEELDALFQCSQCSFTTKNEQQSFVRHLKETHNILKYVQCNYCSARYTDTNTVKRHMNFFHKDRCKKYKLLSLSLLFKEVKHEMNKEELVSDLKHVDGITGNEKVSSQTYKTKSKKVELIDNTTTSSSLKKHKRKILPKVDKDSSPTCKVDVKEQISIDKNKSSPQSSPVKQKQIKISTALDKDSKALISVQPDEKSSVILSVTEKECKTLPTSSPVDHISESEVDKSTKVLLSFKKKDSPSKQTSGQKGQVLKEKSKECKSAAVSSGAFSSKNKIEDVLEDKTHKVNDEKFKYRCKFCNYQDNDTSKMRQHLFVHWHYKPYKCSFCLQGFVSAEKRAVHAKVVHENIVTFCHLKKNKEIEASVNKMLKVFERLEKKAQKMTKIVTKIDPDCLKNEKSMKKEKEHVDNLCTYMSKENSNLANTSSVSFKCFHCSKSNSSLEGLRIHFGKKHGDISKKNRFWIDNKTGQICNMSGAMFEDITNKITYRQSFLCGYCSMRSSKRASVIKHQRFDHSTKMTFIVNLNNAQVSKHRLAKIPDVSEEPVAKKIKLDKTLSLNKNEVVESSTKPSTSAQSIPTQYCCNHCHHKERSLYHYRRHLASHGTFRYLSPDISQSSALRCGCCDYIASDEKDFSKHVTCHVSGERPYKCGYCSYDAFTPSKVRLHLRSVHSGKEKIIDRQRSRAAAIISPGAKTLVDIEPVVKVKDIMAVPAAEFGDLLLKHGVTTIDLSYVEDDKMLQILKLFGSGIPEDQLYDLLNE